MEIKAEYLQCLRGHEKLSGGTLSVLRIREGKRSRENEEWLQYEMGLTWGKLGREGNIGRSKKEVSRVEAKKSRRDRNVTPAWATKKKTIPYSTTLNQKRAR